MLPVKIRFHVAGSYFGGCSPFGYYHLSIGDANNDYAVYERFAQLIHLCGFFELFGPLHVVHQIPINIMREGVP
jgi:hypothetical protein